MAVLSDILWFEIVIIWRSRRHKDSEPSRHAILAKE